MDYAASNRVVVFAPLFIVILTSVVIVIALTSHSPGDLTSARDRCERSGGIWHDSAGHGSGVAHCMGGKT